MESTNKKQPLFWINPNTRINFPHFRIEWHRCEKYELLALCEVKQECGTIYKAGSNCVCLLHSRDFSIVHILYSDDVDFTNIRLQKWLRENIRNAGQRLFYPKDCMNLKLGTSYMQNVLLLRN